jgi:hypothetical protein
MAMTPIRLQVFEILDKAAKQRAKKDKIKVLQENDMMALRDVLRGSFDKVIQWNLPSGPVPYTPASEESPPNTLLKAHMNFKYFVKGLLESQRLTPLKREKMFIDMCESVHPRDAEVLVAMINKETPVKGITKTLVKEAFPDLLVE